MASYRIQRQVERLLDEAEKAFVEHDWNALLSHAQDVIRLDSENREALTFLSAAEQALGSSPPTGQQPPATQRTPDLHPAEVSRFAPGDLEICLGLKGSTISS